MFKPKLKRNYFKKPCLLRNETFGRYYINIDQPPPRSFIGNKKTDLGRNPISTDLDLLKEK